jgi:hypothetical protein
LSETIVGERIELRRRQRRTGHRRARLELLGIGDEGADPLIGVAGAGVGEERRLLRAQMLGDGGVGLVAGDAVELAQEQPARLDAVVRPEPLVAGNDRMGFFVLRQDEQDRREQAEHASPQRCLSPYSLALEGCYGAKRTGAGEGILRPPVSA